MKIKLTESKLKQIVAESVRKMLNEIGDTPRGQFALGAVAARDDERQSYMPFDEYVKKNKGYGKGKYSPAFKAAMTAGKNSNPDNSSFFNKGYFDYSPKEREKLQKKYPNGRNESPAILRGLNRLPIRYDNISKPEW